MGASAKVGWREHTRDVCAYVCVCVCVCVREREQIHAFWKTIWQETHQIAISGYLCEGKKRGWDFTFSPYYVSLVLKSHNEHLFIYNICNFFF